jgi:hypothetical protein
MEEAAQGCSEDEDVLRIMIARGIFDEDEKRWAAAVRSMWYASAMADRLLVMHKKEQTRVRSLSFSCMILKAN